MTKGSTVREEFKLSVQNRFSVLLDRPSTSAQQLDKDIRPSSDKYLTQREKSNRPIYLSDRKVVTNLSENIKTINILGDSHAA